MDLKRDQDDPETETLGDGMDAIALMQNTYSLPDSEKLMIIVQLDD